jgi:hypothetical protein
MMGLRRRLRSTWMRGRALMALWVSLTVGAAALVPACGQEGADDVMQQRSGLYVLGLTW